MKSEFNQEAVNDAMEMGQSAEVDDQADEIYNGILGEIGLEYQIQDPVLIIISNIIQTVLKGKI